MRKTLTSIGLAGLLLTGCEPTKPHIWTEKDIKETGIPISIPITEGDISGFAHTSQFYVTDFDNDNEADAIYSCGSAFYLAEGYQKKTTLYVNKETKIMTPEMREQATSIMNAGRDLIRNTLISKGLYKE